MRVPPLAAALLALAATASWAPADGDVRRDVVRALSARDVGERTTALDVALKGADDEDAAAAVIELAFVDDAPQRVLDVAVRALGRMTSDGAGAAVDRALAKPQRLRRVLVAEALGRGGDVASRRRLEKLACSEDVRVRAAAVTALGDRRDPGAQTALRAALEDPEWTVRSAAIRGLRSLGDPADAPLLADVRSRSAGRLVDDASDAIRSLPAPEAPAAGAPTVAPWTPPPASFDTALFACRSRNVLFVLSTADTMKDPVHGAAENGAVAAAVARAGEDLAADLADAKTKLDLARVHLRAMLRTLADGVEFDVLTYGGSPSFAFGAPTRADASTRRKAEARIARLSAAGPPDLHAALLRVFDPRGKDPLDAPDGADTVVWISDGSLPTTGGVSDRSEVGPRAVRWNRARQIRFVTVNVGQADPAVTGLLASGPPPGISVSVP